MKYSITLLMLTLLLISCTEKKDLNAELEAKNIQICKELITNLNSGDFSKFDTYFDEAYLNRRPSKDSHGSGRAALKADIERFRQAFPTAKDSIEHIVADGDIIMMHTGTSHVMGDGQSAYVLKMKNGKIIETWGFH